MSVYNSPIAIKIPIEVDIQGEDQIEYKGKQQSAHVKAYKAEQKRKEETVKGRLKAMFETDFGVGKGRDAFNFLQNPKMGITSFLKGAGPALLAVVMAYELAPRVAKLLTSRGQVFDLTFRNEAGTLNNILRSRESQQEILAGIGTQVIFTTRAGTIDPRDSYNAYYDKETDEAAHQRQWQIRDTYGV